MPIAVRSTGDASPADQATVRRLNLALLVGIVLLSWFAGQTPGSREIVWSPYQKLVLWEMDLGKGVHEYNITVNATAPGVTLSSRIRNLYDDERLADFAAATYGGRPEDVAFAADFVSVGGRSIAFADLVQQAYRARREAR